MNQTQIETQIEIASLCIAELKRERVQLTEWQRNALAVTKRQAETIKALEEESERLRVAMASRNDEITQALGKALGYAWYRDDPANFPGATEADGVCVGEHVAETIAHEAANRIATLLAELAKAPRWVPVSECEACAYESVIVCDAEDGYWCEAFRCEEHTWNEAGGDELSFTPTHFLANLNPPEIAPNEAQSQQCVDMLNRPVAVGDVLWDAIARTFGTHVADATTPDSAAYDHCVRVPRPGEQVPHFDVWQDMCLAMQAYGAVFERLIIQDEWRTPDSSRRFSFSDRVSNYRRSKSCTWEGPK